MYHISNVLYKTLGKKKKIKCIKNKTTEKNQPNVTKL